MDKKEPLFTNYTENFKGTLDYVWFSAETLSLLAISKVDDEEALLDEAALPSSTRPSDHISLVVTVLFATEETTRIREMKHEQLRMVQENRAKGLKKTGFSSLNSQLHTLRPFICEINGIRNESTAQHRRKDEDGTGRTSSGDCRRNRITRHRLKDPTADAFSQAFMRKCWRCRYRR